MASNNHQEYKLLEELIEKARGIEKAVIVDKGSRYLKKRLAVYFICSEPVDINVLRELVSKEVNKEEAPLLYICKEQFVYTEDGKIDFNMLFIEPLSIIKTDKGNILSQYVFDPLYLKLKTIWMEELNLPRLQPWHCFFNDLGGDSVFAEFVVKRIEEELNIRLPYFILYRYRTLAGLTEYIHRGGDKKVSVDTMRLPLNENSPVIIFVPPVKGGADTYNFVLKTYPEEFGLYVVTYNIVDEKSRYFYSLNELMDLAAASIDQMNFREISLLGYSLGGLLAYEIATRLYATRLKKVILLDIPPARKRGRNLTGLIGQDFGLISLNLKRKDRKALTMNIRHVFWCIFYLLYRGNRIVWFERRSNLTMSEAAHLRFYRQFNHREFRGDLLLIRSTDTQFQRYRYDWERFVKGEVKTKTFEAGHSQLLQPVVLEKLTELVVQVLK